MITRSGCLSDDMSAAAWGAGVRRLLQKEYTVAHLADLVHSVVAEARARSGKVVV